MDITFTSRAAGLMAEAGGRRYKFVAGSLTVSPSEAVDIRAYAATHPTAGIVEVASPAVTMSMKKDELLVVAQDQGVDVDATDTKAEIIDAIVSGDSADKPAKGTEE